MQGQRLIFRFYRLEKRRRLFELSFASLLFMAVYPRLETNGVDGGQSLINVKCYGAFTDFHCGSHKF